MADAWTEWLAQQVAILREAIEARDLTKEAAAREAILLGDGALLVRVSQRCPACGIPEEAVWFNSRGWVCVACNEDVPGIRPTAEQRMVGKVPQAAVNSVLSQFREGYPHG